METRRNMSEGICAKCGGETETDEDSLSICCGFPVNLTAPNAEVVVKNLQEKLKTKDAELEDMRVSLAACGVAASANTEETVAHRINRRNKYWSASYGDVCRMVDREIALRNALVCLIGVADRTPCLCMSGRAPGQKHKKHCVDGLKALGCTVPK